MKWIVFVRDKVSDVSRMSIDNVSDVRNLVNVEDIADAGRRVEIGHVADVTHPAKTKN